jgi:hypothetical protein
MTIEDRVRRVLTDAVADEPPQRGVPLHEVTDDAGNLSFRHPPGWDVRPSDRGGSGLADG